MGRMTGTEGMVFTDNGNGSENVAQDSDTDQSDSVSQSVDESGTSIDSSNMTEGQRKLISALGLNPDNITITPEMVACAEAKLGTARVEEIKNGATPSFSEGASLVVCYK